MENLLKGFKDYQTGKYLENKEHMESLSGGQSPHTLLITCADSRISVNEISNSRPGEVFVIRNAGNVIEEYNPDNPSNEALTLEYGINALGIQEIVVCGHASCGAMGGIKDLDGLSALPLVQSGLTRVAKQFKGTDLKAISLEDLIELNVKEQLKHIYSYPFVKEKVDSGELNVWGWVYDFANGDLTFKKNLKELL